MVLPMPIDEIKKRVSPHIKKDYSLLDDQRRLHGVLNDCLRNKEAKNLLMIGFREDVCTEAKKYTSLDEDILMRCKNRLVYKQSLDSKSAAWVVIAWFCILGRNVHYRFIEDLEEKNKIENDRSNSECISEKQLTDIGEYAEEYSEEGLWNKVTKNAKSIGAQLLYEAMQIYYATDNPECPKKVKATIYGALGYLILPLDLIPDLMPVVGYTEDAAAIAAALVLARTYIDDSVKYKAKRKLQDILGHDIVKVLDE